MFDHKEVLPLDFNSQRSCDPYEALRAFNEIPLTDSVDVQAGRTEMNAMVTTNIEKAPAKQKEQWQVDWCWRRTSPGNVDVVVHKTIDGSTHAPYVTNSLDKGLYSLECTQNGAVLNRVNGSLQSHFM